MEQLYSRYRNYDPDEAEPGSDGKVLRNKLGVTDPELMQEYEMEFHRQALGRILDSALPEVSVTCEMIKRWHRWALGELYDWAGEYRTVELSLPDEDLQFCPSKNIAASMERYEREYLKLLTPLSLDAPDTYPEMLAKPHAELVIIHPFRDGNGRIARDLVDFLLVQANTMPAHWQVLKDRREDYYTSIRLSVLRDYRLLASLLREAIDS